MVLLKWHGHACFEIVSSRGIRIVIDPHDGYSLGIKPPKAEADIVLITHDHFDHNAYSVVAKPSAHIIKMQLGDTEINDIKIRGVEAYHDTVKGRRRGRVVIYRVEVDKVSFVHLGDLGHELSSEYREKLSPIDILLIPVGGVFTIDAKSAWNVIDVLSPKVVVPMHYWIDGLNLPLKPVDNFISIAKEPWRVEKVDENYISIDPSAIPTNTIYVLKPP